MTALLIALTGATGVGKDTVCQILVDQVKAVRIAFGDPVKKAAQAAFGLEDVWLTDAYKTTVHPFWGLTPREMSQLVGTEAFRGTFGPDIWVRRAEIEVARIRHEDPAKIIVVSDLRAPDNIETEADWVRREGGVVVHIEGPQRRADVNVQHSSNALVKQHPQDYVLHNDGSMRQLRTLVQVLFCNIVQDKIKEQENATA
jgi:hypothetical protein